MTLFGWVFGNNMPIRYYLDDNKQSLMLLTFSCGRLYFFHSLMIKLQDCRFVNYDQMKRYLKMNSVTANTMDAVNTAKHIFEFL